MRLDRTWRTTNAACDRGICSEVAVMLGPVFFPSSIVLGLELLFWRHKSLIQNALYPVVANAYLFLFGNLVIRFIDAHPMPYEGANIAVFFSRFVMLLPAFTYKS